jgi:uncharacterized membrane protein
MHDTVTSGAARSPATLAPDRTERIIGWAALVMLAVVATALLRGSAHWGALPWQVWVHLATMMIALALTPKILWNRRGDRRHRQLGYVWVGSLAITALISLDIRLSHNGGFSLVHILSFWTLIQLPILVWSARQHNHLRHRRAVRGMAIGALLIAGLFTFPFGRLLGQWLFG